MEYHLKLLAQWKNLPGIDMYIFGASGHGKVILESLLSSGHKVEGVFDDDETIKDLMTFHNLGSFRPELFPNGAKLIIAIGDNQVREKIAKQLDVDFGSAIHNTAVISTSAKIKNGVAIMANTVVNAACIIGEHVILNTMSSVDHDSVIGDFVHIGPKATICGGVKIEKGAFIGAGATVVPNVSIGAYAVIGAGAVITKDVKKNTVVVNCNQVIKG